MTNHAKLDNAIESDFRAIASRSRAVEMKRLWQGMRRVFGRTQESFEQSDVAPTKASEPAVLSIPVVNDEPLQKAA